MAPTTAADLARAYIDALQAKDKKAILALFADNFALEVPCSLSGANDGSDNWQGMAAAHANYDLTFKIIQDLVYVDIDITAGKDPNVAFLEGRGAMKMANGRPYRNVYVFRFDSANGKITRIREYTNPVTAAIAFGLALPETTVDMKEKFVNPGR